MSLWILAGLGAVIVALLLLALWAAYRAGGDDRELQLIYRERDKLLAKLRADDVKEDQQSNEP